MELGGVSDQTIDILYITLWIRPVLSGRVCRGVGGGSGSEENIICDSERGGVRDNCNVWVKGKPTHYT